MNKPVKFVPLLLLGMAITLLSGCGESAPQQDPGKADASQAAQTAAQTNQAPVASNPNKNAYFGDTHIHTILSLDAYLMGTRRTPDAAYEFAKGAAIEHASGFKMKMKKPLDFLAVSDHAFYLGMMRELGRGEGSSKKEAETTTSPSTLAVRTLRRQQVPS